MVDFGQALSAVTNQNNYRRAAWAGAGYVTAVVLRNVVEANAGQELPDEIYGVGSIALHRALGMPSMAQVGGGLYVVHKLSQRVGLDATVMQLGA